MRPQGGGAPWAALAGTGARTNCRGGKRHRMNSGAPAGLAQHNTTIAVFQASLLVEIRHTPRYRCQIDKSAISAADAPLQTTRPFTMI